MKNVLRISYDKATLLYRIDIPYSVFASFDVRQADNSPLVNLGISVDVSELPDDVYIYDQIKLVYKLKIVV